MKSFKKLLVCAFVSVLCLTGCEFTTSKTAVDADTFSNSAENLGFEIYDITDQYTDYDFIESVTVAKNSDDNYQVEFYVLGTEANAISMYATNKTKFEESKGSTSGETSMEIGNYATYSLTSDGYYMYVSRVDNTLIYIKVSKEYKDNVVALVDELGY